MLLRTAAITLLLTFVVALALPTTSHAQVIDRYGVKVGVVSASASNNLSFDISTHEDYTSKDFGRRTGLAVWIFAERQVLPFLALAGEVGYVQRGFTETPLEYYYRGVMPVDYAATAADASTRLDYLSVAVMAKSGYDLARMRLYALAGPRVDVLLSIEAGEFSTPEYTLDSKSAYVRGYESWAVGGTFGAGMLVDVGLRGRLLLEARYAFDVTDSLSWEPSEMRNNAVSFVVGVAF